MRIEVNQKELKGKEFERGDYALVIMNDLKIIDIQKLEGIYSDSSNHAENTDFLKNLYTNGVRNENLLYKVQFLSNNAFSRDFETKI